MPSHTPLERKKRKRERLRSMSGHRSGMIIKSVKKQKKL